jgi:glycosyltransferase involved in cell wall biosynthesis
MKILFVTSVPLLPTCDGIRIPAAHHFYGLREAFDVDLLLLNNFEQQAKISEIEATLSLVPRSAVVSVIRIHRHKVIFRELMYAEPYFGALGFNEALPNWIAGEKYDCVWCATAPAAGMFALSNTRSRFNAKKYVAGLSDIHSLVTLRQSNEASKSESIYYKTISRTNLWLYSKVLLRSEGQMLNHFDMVTMQTKKEYEWVKRYYGKVSQKSLILPNGVSPVLFDSPIERSIPSLLFVGALHGMYGERLKWFIQNVWIKIREIHKGVTMHVVGKRSSTDLEAIFAREEVSYQPYVHSIEDEYARHAILVAPIFKGFGLINKVVEAMAAGCLVVGDKTAFNGIESFKANLHGRVADDSFAFVKEISSVLESADFCKNERLAGRRLIYENFNWESRYLKIKESVSVLCRES